MIIIADRYWILGTGYWADTSHWSTSSGGSGGASVPTSTDNAYFDANSFSSAGQTVTIEYSVSAKCLDMDWTGTTNSPTLVMSRGISVYGSLTLISAMTISGSSSSISFQATSAGKTIESAGNSFTQWTFNGAGGEWILRDDAIVTNGIFFNNSTTLRTNNHSVITTSFYTFYADNSVSIYLGSSVVTVTDHWLGTSPPATLDTGTSTIKMIGNDQNFLSRGFAYYNVEFQGTPIRIQGNGTYNEIKISAGKTVNIDAGTTQTVNTLTAIGTSGSPITIQSYISGSPAIVSKSSGVVEVDYCSIKDITATGGASFYADNSTNVSGNSGWYFVTNRPTVADTGSGADAASILAALAVADGHEHTQPMAIGIGYVFDPAIDTGCGADVITADIVANTFWEDVFDSSVGVDDSLTVTGTGTLYHQYIADGHQTTQLAVGVGAVFDPSLDTGYGADSSSVLALLTDVADAGHSTESARVLAGINASDIGHGVDVGSIGKAFFLIDSHNILQPLGVFVLRDSREELAPTTRNNTDTVPGRHGEIDFGTELEARIMEFKVHINTTPEEKTALKRTLAAYLNPLLGAKPFVDSHDINKTYYVKYAGSIDLTNYVNAMQFTIPFKACDPIIYGTFEQTQTGSGTITNEGTLETPLTITITGAATNPSVVVGSHTLTYTGTLGAGDTLIIDTEALTCKLNGVNAIGDLTGLSLDVVLGVGDTAVTAASAGITTFKWRECWI